MYEKIVDENPYETPMMIYPAVHYTMGGVWVDYNLMTTIPGCFAIGEANFSDQEGFKQVYGNTVFGYLFEHKMNVASQMLTSKNHNVNEVALLDKQALKITLLNPIGKKHL